jgi:valyl-tRNA synthetase
LRYSLMMITATGQDVFLSNDKFEIGRNFGTKLWNAARFMQMHESSGPATANRGADDTPASLDPALLSADDAHLLARLQQAIEQCTDNLDKFRFNDAAQTLYEFVWHQYCDWYVEYAKDTLYGQDAPRRAQVLRIMHYVFSNALRLLHPFMPFVTEELWHAMGYGGETDSIMRSRWPVPLGREALGAFGITEALVQYVDDKHELIRTARTLKADYGIAPNQKVSYRIKANSAEIADRLNADCASLVSLMRAESMEIRADLVPSKAMPTGVSQLGTVYMPIEGLVDVAAEVARQKAQLDKVMEDLDRTSKKLENEGFVSKAKPEVVEQQRQKKQELMEKGEKLRRLIDMLSSL